jgi:hypothetical protein
MSHLGVARDLNGLLQSGKAAHEKRTKTADNFL